MRSGKKSARGQEDYREQDADPVEGESLVRSSRWRIPTCLITYGLAQCSRLK